MITEITGQEQNGYEIDVKRFYLPFVITVKCPACGHEMKRDLGNDYLSFPVLGTPEPLRFSHEIGEYGKPDYAEHEWVEKIVLKISVEKAE